MLYISSAVAAHAWIKFFVGKWGQSNVTNFFAGVGWGGVHGLFFFIFFFVEFYEINEGAEPPISTILQILPTMMLTQKQI